MKESLVYGVAGTLNRFVGVLLVPLYTRLFAPADYGLLDLLTTSSALLSLLSGLQIESGVAREYYEAKSKQYEKELLGTALVLSTVSGLFWSAVAFIVFMSVIQGYAGLTALHITAILLLLIPTQFMAIFLVLLRFQRRPGVFLFFSSGDVLLGTLLTIYLVVYQHWGILGVLWGLCISKIFWSSVMLLVLRKHFRIVWRKQLARRMVFYSAPLIPAVLTKWGQNYANRFILATTFTLAQLGIYSLAVKIASGFALVDMAFRMAWDPYAIELMNEPGFERKYARAFDFYLLGMFAISLLMVLLGTPVVRIMAGQAYQDAGRLVGLITIGLFWTSMDKFFALGNSVVRKTYWNLAGYIPGVLINLFVLWMLGNRWGLFAAGMAYILGGVVSSVALLWVAQRNHYVPYRRRAVVLSLLASVSYAAWTYLAEPIALRTISLGIWLLINGAIALILIFLLGLSIFSGKVMKEWGFNIFSYLVGRCQRWSNRNY